MKAIKAIFWILANLRSLCRACAEEEADAAAKAQDAGLTVEEYRARQAEIEARWAREVSHA